MLIDENHFRLKNTDAHTHTHTSNRVNVQFKLVFKPTKMAACKS